jgi:ferrous iron transport protein A
MPDNTACSLGGALPLSVAPSVAVSPSLADLPLGAHARVIGVRIAAASREARELALRLLEIGFMEGEPVRVIAHGHPGREPIAVRVGGTTFALRRFEAEQVLVALDAGGATR